MRTAKSIKLNFLMSALLTISSIIFPIITFPYVSRVLLATGIGKVYFATSVVSYFVIISQMGIPQYGIRACAKVRDDKEKLTKVTHELLIINLIMSGVSYILLFFAISCVTRLKEEKTLLFIISFTILLNALGVEWLYKALEEYTYITIRSIVFKFVALILMFVFIRSREDYIKYGLISIVASSCSNIFNFFHVRKFISLKPLKKYNLRRHYKYVATFFLMSCAVTIYTHLDSAMLGFLKTDADVGYYNAAIKVKSVLVSMITSLGVVLLPRASYYVERKRMEEYRSMIKKAMNFVIISAFPLMIYFIFFAKPAILLLSGNTYKEAIIPMQIIMPTLLLIGLTNITGIQILVPTGRETSVLISEVVGAGVDVVMNYILIPHYASAGAAVGTLIAEIAVLIVQFGFLKSELRDYFSRIAYPKTLVSTLISILLSVWIIKFNFIPIITLAISSVIFFTVYCGLMIILKESLMVEIFHDAKSKIRSKL